MRKITSLLMLLCLIFIGQSINAQVVVTTVTAEKKYTFECRSSQAHSTNRFLAETGGALNGQSSTPTAFTFETAGEGTWYLKSLESGKYVNATGAGTTVTLDETATTAWTVGQINATDNYVYLSMGTNLYLNNHDNGTNHIRIASHNPITAGNACSLWEMCEIRPAVIGENTNITKTWSTSLWESVDNVPTGVTTVESTQYPSNTSNVKATTMSVEVQKGYLQSEFIYSSGSNRLDILGAELIDDKGDVVAYDYHFGFSGGKKVDNVYTLAVETAGTYTLRYWVSFCAEANTSGGNINIYHVYNPSITSLEQLSNEKCYTVTAQNRGTWYSDATRINGTAKVSASYDASNNALHFAFVKSQSGSYYLYSVKDQKFVSKSGDYTTYTDEPVETVSFLNGTRNKVYPWVIALNGQNQLGVSNGYDPSVISFYNDLSDEGNCVNIAEVAEFNATAALAKIEVYEAAKYKAELNEKLTEAKELDAKEYINSAALTEAIATAQAVYDNNASTTAQIKEQKELLSAAILAAGYVNVVGDFSNNAIYTFVAKRNETSYMMYDPETPDYVASKYMKTGLEAGNDKVNCQWAVYKSSRGYYYLYNLGAQKFMGTQSEANTSIPFSATPQTTSLTFKVSAVSTHPIMFSTDGGNGAANHSNNEFEGKNQAGLINWAGGFGQTTDDGNVQKVTIVGAIDDETLTAITTLVEEFETRFTAIQALGTYLDEFYANYYDAWGSGWRNKAGVNNYTQPEGDEPIDEAYEEARAFYNAITEEISVDAIIARKTYLEGLEANLTINQPENNKFYRLRCVDGKNYLSSSTSEVSETDADVRFEMVGANESNPDLMFMYNGANLLSYSKGLYINAYRLNEVGSTSAVVFTAAANGEVGQYNINVGERYIYGKGDTKNNHIDSGAGAPSASGYNWWLEEVTSLPVSVTAAGFSTLYAPVALTIPANMIAYTGVEEGEYLVLTQVEGTIPANTAVILEAAEGAYNFAITTGGETIANNALAGTVNTIERTGTPFTLQKRGDVVGFYPYNGANLSGFKAYLPAASSAKGLTFKMGETTAIDALLKEDGQMEIYDLNGRRLNNLQKGINIVNGKKVLVK